MQRALIPLLSPESPGAKMPHDDRPAVDVTLSALLDEADFIGIRDASAFWPLAERLSITHGVERPAAGAGYERDAFIPRDSWEPVPKALVQRWAAPSRAWDMKCTLGIVRVPEEALAGLARVGLARAPDRETYRSALAHPEVHAGFEEVAMALGEHLVSPDGLRVLGPAARLPGMRTVTPDEARGGLLVGLHLDAWDELAPTGVTTNRICVNLGREERAFLYVPMAADRAGLKDPARGTDRVERFFEATPRCPVVRVRLAPGEAYIAPTEHILHDGTTELSRSLDVTLTLRGQFALG